MGLDTSHDCWHGAYSAFHRWRIALAEAAGLPPLEQMNGYSTLATKGTLKWSQLKPDVLHVLLDHSDSTGWIPAEHCGPLADRLEELMPALAALPDDWGHLGNIEAKTAQFISGLRLAAAAGENVEFG